jgi:hypothetical protein
MRPVGRKKVALSLHTNNIVSGISTYSNSYYLLVTSTVVLSCYLRFHGEPAPTEQLHGCSSFCCTECGISASNVEVFCEDPQLKDRSEETERGWMETRSFSSLRVVRSQSRFRIICTKTTTCKTCKRQNARFHYDRHRPRFSIIMDIKSARATMHSTLLQLQLDDELHPLAWMEFQVLLQCLVLSPEKTFRKFFFLFLFFFSIHYSARVSKSLDRVS